MAPASAAAFERAVRDTFGTPPFKDIPAPNEENIQRIEQALSKLAATYQGQQYLFGNDVTYADLVVAAYLVALTRALTDDEMAQFRTWDAGKWSKMTEQFEALGYYAEDEGEIYR
jgi:glutathione S-transferase